MAWQPPPLMRQAADGKIEGPAGSNVAQAQMQLLQATRQALASVADDVRQGLLETVGVGSRWVEGERCSVVIELPPGTDTEKIARAVDMENVEAWCDEYGQVHVGIGPWYTTKDVDQTVLSVVKVVHVLLGLHAPPTANGGRRQALSARLLGAVAEVLTLLQQSSRPEDAGSK